MTALRTLVLRHHLLAMVLVGAALGLRMVMPAGFMVAPEAKVLTVRICVDSLDHDGIAQIAVPMKGAAGKTGGECAFSSLSMAATGGTDAILLAIALAFILALGFAPAPAPRPRRTSRLRPPLRGPPLPA
jgi:hypothetical protein